MYFVPYMYQYPHSNYPTVPMYNYGMQSFYWPYPNEVALASKFEPYRFSDSDSKLMLKDYGPKPYVVDINEATKQNNTYRTALWTGTHLQVTLMSLNVGEDIGLEIHPDVDQFLRIEQGQGIVQMGASKDSLNFERNVFDDSAIMIPAGTWHNLTNTGSIPLKLYSIYAPPNHPFGTVHPTKADAVSAEEEDHHPSI
ncbi:cupin [Lysinibacillus contaminans]|uniref:Cupin n=1 Tax=Lysinibacillus contaminans TaxID=1293441 RepID=A0ABR5K495_9BACI|nr:cupin domain-containing protein [Lysinibacillus contaminans]KOS69701.1 cupin [Lysinibacillus contaminans]